MTDITSYPEIIWPKDFKELKEIDDALKCGICKDYMKTCMLTPCGHSYCSICIRKSLLYSTSCPVCWESTFENTLKNNYVLDKILEVFVTIRDRLIKHLKIAAIHFNGSDLIKSPLPLSSSARKETNLETNIFNATPKRNTPPVSKPLTSKGKLNFTPSSGTSKSLISKKLDSILANNNENNKYLDEIILDTSEQIENVEENDAITVPPMFLQQRVETQNKPEQPVVPCPVCNVDIPERNINLHLDSCLANVDREPTTKKQDTINTKPKRKPLQKLVWSLMGEKDLRKKLKEYKLNAQGDRKAMTERLKRYTLLYNSECDSHTPRSVEEIIRQIEREEKVKDNNQQQLQQLPRVNRKMDPVIIEVENKKYLNDNKSSFMKLIESMKEREGKNIKPVSRSRNRISSDDEEEQNVSTTENRLNLPNGLDKPSTSKAFQETVDLCDEDDEISSSPILGAGLSTPKPKTADKSSAEIVESDEDIVYSSEEQSVPPVQRPENNAPSPAKSLTSPPAKPLSPNCKIITAHSDSDSEASFSLLNDQDAENDFFNATLTEDVKNKNSQLDDPDFVVDELFDSEEIFEAPKRVSKRKLIKSPPLEEDANQVRSPRRSKRRIIK